MVPSLSDYIAPINDSKKYFVCFGVFHKFENGITKNEFNVNSFTKVHTKP